jgi:hypothetical protein
MRFSRIHKVSYEKDKAVLCLGVCEITAMVVSPYALYCYWEINQGLSADIILTIYNRTTDVSWEIDVSPKKQDFYVEISPKEEEAMCDFQVALGVKIPQGVTPVALSNIVSVPSRTPSILYHEEWWGAPDEDRYIELGHYHEKRVSCAYSPLSSSVCSPPRTR